jgi:hypothetical protein
MLCLRAMKNLRSIADSELIEKTRSLVGEERSITAEILTYLEEIDRRRLYLERGYPSLFDFSCKFLGYSADQAMRRISAMRVTRDVPAIRAEIEAGTLSLTNAAKAQTFLNAERKAGKTYSLEAKRELLSELSGLSTRECDARLAEKSPEAPRPDRLRPISASQTQITFTADEELMQDLAKIRALLAHSEKDGSYGELLKRMTQIVLAKIDPDLKITRARPSAVAPKAKLPQVIRTIPAAVRAAVWKRDQGKCQYLDAQTGKTCHSPFRIEYEHVQPFALGGPSTIENLTLRCAGHNRLAATHAFGEEWMARFSRTGSNS